MEEEIIDMWWPAKSPDMNVIENAWGELTRRLYYRGRQFDSVDGLKEALWYEWDNLDLKDIRDFIKSMPDRIDDLKRKRGRATRYLVNCFTSAFVICAVSVSDGALQFCP